MSKSSYKYYLSVGAMFKNETHSLKEWVRHYLHHGVEHFYLINDNSTDNSVETIQEYIDEGRVSLFTVEEPYYLGRQRTLYNRHILPHLKETKWLLMVDIDEYVWSKMDVNLSNILRTSERLGQIQIRQTIFGSNGYIQQPSTVVPFFTKRREDNSQDKKYKYFVNSAFEFSSLNVHHANFSNPEQDKDGSIFIITDFDYFIMNHYCCQSREFWETVKSTRGDSDNYLVRNSQQFDDNDLNEVEDLELYNQNRNLYEDLLLSH